MEDITDYLINREDSIEYKTSDKNVANIETNIKNLLEYIYKDEIYNNYKNGECNSFNDFEVFCINHCKDIENLLIDNGQLREKVKELEKERKENKKKYLALLLGQFPDTTETYKKYKKELDKLLEETNG